MKLRLKNSCSIRETELEFQPGKVYLITGGNNSGKSSLFYSLSSALLNSKETKCYINNQALKEDPNATMEVELVDDAGSSYRYDRTPSSSKYTINGREFRKLNRSNIFSFTNGQIPGLLYDEGDVRKIVNIQGEENGMFPFDRTEGEQFKLFEKIFNISSTIVVLRSMSLDETDIDSKLKENTSSIDENTRKLQAFTNFISEVKTEDIQKFREYFVEKSNILSNMYNDILTGNNLVTFINSCAELKEKTDLKDISRQHTDIEQDYLRVCNLTKSIAQISELKEYKTKFNVDKYNELYKDTQNAEHYLHSYESSMKEIDMLEADYRQIKSQLATVDVCPICKTPVKGDDLC